MTQVIVAIAVVAAVVVVLCIVMIARRRYDDESDRFRHVADLTSAWSRETLPPVQQPPAPKQVQLPPSPGEQPPPAKAKRTTDSVDTR